MEKIIDLHTHSTYSDGSETPWEIVLEAKKKNLYAVALTDHDTIDGIEEFMAAGKEFHLETIPGIEFATSYDGKGEIHIVGLFLDTKTPLLLEAMDTIQKSRIKRNIKMAERLSSLGFPITLEELEREAGGEIITRAHYALLLVKKGYIKNRQEAFDNLISPGLPGYVERETLSPRACIESIQKSGGVSVLAHPTLYHMDYYEVADMCRSLISYGLDAIECMYSTYTPSQQKKIKQIADNLQLLPSGGSDFHGANKENIALGIGKGNLKIPYQYLKDLKIRSNLNRKSCT